MAETLAETLAGRSLRQRKNYLEGKLSEYKAAVRIATRSSATKLFYSASQAQTQYRTLTLHSERGFGAQDADMGVIYM